jgi:hypothetical protein
MEPKRPRNVPAYSDICLRALHEHNLGGKISLGGAFGLMHYFEYRSTYDIDAWWSPSATGEDQRRVISLLENTLRSYGEVHTRSWGDVVSVALVERGAPRDFLDIYHLCREGLYTPEQCWRLWQHRQQLAESDTSTTRADMALQTHLARIEQHRPLLQISDTAARESAQRLRAWFKKEFSDALKQLD